MEVRASYVSVGIFVVVLTTAAFAALIWFGRLDDTQRYDRYRILFSGNVSGLSVGSAVRLRGVPVALSPLEYRLVTFLLRHRGRVVPQHELAENVYGHDEDHDSNALEVLIGRVRKKLGPELIETRRGFGYLVPETPA